MTPIVLVYFARAYLYESVRYLVSRGLLEQANTVVRQIEIDSIGHAQPADAVLLGRIIPDVEGSHGLTVTDLLSPSYRRTTALLWLVSFCFFWSANGLLFMLPTILTQRGIPLNRAISFALVQGICGFLGYVTCGYLIDQFGRRSVLTTYFFVGAAFHLWFAEASGIWMYVAIAGVGWVNPGVFGPSSVYACELYPTHLRATAVGWYFGIGRIGSFLAPMTVGFLLAGGYGYYVLHTFAFTYLIAAIAVFAIGIETRGRILEDITRGLGSGAGTRNRTDLASPAL
jgi:MFS transporter, putative metabolite:H+ symporter